MQQKREMKGELKLPRNSAKSFYDRHTFTIIYEREGIKQESGMDKTCRVNLSDVRHCDAIVTSAGRSPCNGDQEFIKSQPNPRLARPCNATPGGKTQQWQ